mmetsp:Transcript_19251/g.32243  ORF Transcript_19251/g.32243 Transcript_19251/m.32243 type:complete len:102 (-) Transcript_19251:2533-2838(-)
MACKNGVQKAEQIADTMPKPFPWLGAHRLVPQRKLMATGSMPYGHLLPVSIQFPGTLTLGLTCLVSNPSVYLVAGNLSVESDECCVKFLLMRKLSQACAYG